MDGRCIFVGVAVDALVDFGIVSRHRTPEWAAASRGDSFRSLSASWGMARRRKSQPRVALYFSALLLAVQFGLFHSAAFAADAVRFSDDKPVRLDAQHLSREVTLVVQRRLEVRVVIEQTSAAVVVTCDGIATTTKECTLTGSDVVVRKISLAWDGKTPGEGMIVASPPDQPPVTLAFKAGADSSSAPTGVAPAELKFRTDRSRKDMSLPATLSVPGKAVPVTGAAPEGTATAMLQPNGAGAPQLSAEGMDQVGTYSWSLDTDGDGKGDLTVKVVRREPWVLCLWLLLLSAALVGGLLFLRDHRLAGLVQKDDVEDLRRQAKAAEAELSSAMKDANVNHVNQEWRPATATEGVVKHELDRLSTSLKSADRPDGESFKVAQAAVDALAAVAENARRVADGIGALLAKHNDQVTSNLIATAVGALEGVDFTNVGLKDYSKVAAPVHTVASNMAAALRLEFAIAGKPADKRASLYQALFAIAATDSGGAFEKLRAQVVTGVLPTPPPVAGTLTYDASAQPWDAAVRWLAKSLPVREWGHAVSRRLNTAPALRAMLLMSAATLAVLSGMSSQYYTTEAWGSTGDILKALTWAAGTTFAIDAVTKLALSSLSTRIARPAGN